jgi:hypothetical protein
MDPPDWSRIISKAEELRDSLQELRNKVLRGTANSGFLDSQLTAGYDFYETIDNLRFSLGGQTEYKPYVETLDATKNAHLRFLGPLELLRDLVKELEDLEHEASRSMLNQKRIKQRDTLLNDRLPNLRGQLEELIKVQYNPAAPSTPPNSFRIGAPRESGGTAGSSEAG